MSRLWAADLARSPLRSRSTYFQHPLTVPLRLTPFSALSSPFSAPLTCSGSGHGSAVRIQHSLLIYCGKNTKLCLTSLWSVRLSVMHRIFKSCFMFILDTRIEEYYFFVFYWNQDSLMFSWNFSKMNEEKLLGLQMQVRQNQQELMDYVKELDGWGDEMKQKEQQLKQESPSCTEVGRNWVSDGVVVLFIYFHWISGNIVIVIVAKVTCKVITFIVNFCYNYDITTYSVKINQELRCYAREVLSVLSYFVLVINTCLLQQSSVFVPPACLHCSSHLSVTSLLATVLTRLLWHWLWMVYRLLIMMLPHCWLSISDYGLICLVVALTDNSATHLWLFTWHYITLL